MNEENKEIEEVTPETTEVPTPEAKKPEITKDYQMDKQEMEVKINVFASADKSQDVVHKVKKPTFADLEARERMSPLLIEDSGKVDGADASSMTLDDEGANVRCYDKIALTVKGYSLKKGTKPTDEEVDVNTILEGSEEKVLALIPDSHKGVVINALFPAEYNVDFGGEEFYFALGSGREWRIKQEIGGKHKLEDGTLAPADFEVFYTFREPTQAERKTYRNKAVNALTLRTATGSKDRRSTNLKVVANLFDTLIESIEGATIKGKGIDVRNREQLAEIPATFKKGAVICLFRFLEADLSD